MATPSMLLSNCARAASASESRYRIDRPIAPARAPRVIALDDTALSVTRRIAREPWANARFYGCEPSPAGGTAGDGLVLRRLDGRQATLEAELAGSDVVVVLATETGGRAYAAAVGRFCGARGIMTAGMVLGSGYEADDAVAALRPYARVLLPSADESDVLEVLRALRV